MKLNEFVDKNGKKVNLNNSSSTSPAIKASSTIDYPSQKNNYEKLLKQIDSDKLFRKYTADRLDDRVVKLTLGNGVEVSIIYKPYVPCYLVQVDGEDMYCDRWEEVLKHLVIEGIIGDTTLCEWLDSKGNKINLNSSSTSQASSSTSTKTNKEKFKELTDYMIAHKGSLTSKAEVVRLDDGGFTYKENWYSSSGQDYTLTLLVGHSRFNSSWKFELYMDTSLVKEVQGDGWEKLLEELEVYFHVPKAGAKEYKEICESYSIADDFKAYENLWD